MKKSIKIIFGLLILMSLLFVGCSQNNNVNTTNSKTEIANPASVYCVNHGGKLEIRNTPNGSIGICHFEDGKSCEEWAFYRGNCSD
jgi:hypothetical protein